MRRDATLIIGARPFGRIDPHEGQFAIAAPGIFGALGGDRFQVGVIGVGIGKRRNLIPPIDPVDVAALPVQIVGMIDRIPLQHVVFKVHFLFREETKSGDVGGVTGVKTAVFPIPHGGLGRIIGQVDIRVSGADIPGQLLVTGAARAVDITRFSLHRFLQRLGDAQIPAAAHVPDGISLMAFVRLADFADRKFEARIAGIHKVFVIAHGKIRGGRDGGLVFVRDGNFRRHGFQIRGF